MSLRPILAVPAPHGFGGSVPLDLESLHVTVANCPPWCQCAEGHWDAVDFPLLRHRSRALLLDPVHGGGDATHTSRVTTSVHVEQFADRSAPPTIVISAEHHGDERFTHLTIAEAKVYRDQLDTAITQAESDLTVGNT